MHNFKKACKTALIFLTMYFVVTMGLITLFLSSEISYYMDIHERNEIAGTVDYMVIGASHAERGFSAKLLDKKLGVNSYNLAAPKMMTWARYDMLEKELARNPVKTVVLEVSFDAVRPRREGQSVLADLYHLARVEGVGAKLKYFFTYIPPQDYVYSYQYLVNCGVEAFTRLCRGTWTPVQIQKRVYKGSVRMTKVDEIMDEVDYKGMFKTVIQEEEIDEKKASYLQMIVDLCKERDVELIVVSCPLSQKEICYKTGLDNRREWYEAFCEKNDLEYYDFSLLRDRDEYLLDAEHFTDSQHLRKNGQDVFTKLFCKYMKMREEGEDLSQYFFESYDEYEKTQPYYSLVHNE